MDQRIARFQRHAASLTGTRWATSAGEAKKALRYFETQAAEFERGAKLDNSPHVYLELASRAYREASNSAAFLGDLEKAVDYGEKAFALASEIDDRRLKFTAITSLYRANRDLKNSSRATELIELGLKLAQEFSPGSINRIYWEAVLYASRSADFRARREYQKAVEDAQRSISLYKDFLSGMPDSAPRSKSRKETAITNMALLYGRLGRTYLAMGKTQDALEQFQLGLELAQGGNLKFAQGYLFQGVGDVHARRSEYREALSYFKKALELAREQRRPEALSDAARRMGDTYRKMGKVSEAIAAYGVAIEQIESIRSLLSSRRNGQSYFGGGLAPYSRLIETLWDTRAYGKAFHYSERVRSRTFLDMLGTKVTLSPPDSALAGEERALAALDEKGESEQAYREFLAKVINVNPEQASAMSVQPLKLNDLQRLLRPNQVLLEYLVTPEKTYLWAVEQSRLRAYTIGVNRKDLVTEVEALRGAIANQSLLDDYQRIARKLYDQLLNPVALGIRGTDLIVVPHDVLHYLPFHALYSPEGKYLIEDHALSYLSSASLLQFVAAKRRKASTSILSIGNPHAKNERDNLPLAESEAIEVKKQFPGSLALLRDDASEAKVKRLSPNYNVLHFASHAELSEKKPLESAILLANGAGEDGRLEVREIFGMKLKANLVVLSGCETALGKLSTGDELVGLTRAFIYAGAQSVVASLWNVDDSFYKNLRTKTKVESLRQAQLEMIRGGVNSELLAQRGVGGIGKLGQTPSSEFYAPSSEKSVPVVSTSHPYFWAPFILVGDGR